MDLHTLIYAAVGAAAVWSVLAYQKTEREGLELQIDVLRNMYFEELSKRLALEKGAQQ